IWYMRPVRVTTEVPYPREDVYDFLDVMSNHEPFTNHMLRDWEYDGPDRGIGSKAHVTASAGGRTDSIEIEVVAAERPTRIVERNVGAGGRRVANGTYVLDELPDGRTRIAFEYDWQRAPLSERLASPLVRGILRRENEKSLRRLADQLATAVPSRQS
ncbi:MAG: SRPBCC family protein, partial [Solirubrobacteraceae bacterium]